MITYKKIKSGEIKKAPKNPRIHSKEQIDQIAKSIKEFGFTNPVLVDENNMLIIIDPFLGSGTTMIAAEKTGRICYGMEIAPHYCDVIVRRWQEYTGKQATLESNGKTFDELEKERMGKQYG